MRLSSFYSSKPVTDPLLLCDDFVVKNVHLGELKVIKTELYTRLFCRILHRTTIVHSFPNNWRVWCQKNIAWREIAVRFSVNRIGVNCPKWNWFRSAAVFPGIFLIRHIGLSVCLGWSAILRKRQIKITQEHLSSHRVLGRKFRTVCQTRAAAGERF